MSTKCEICGKSRSTGYSVSKSDNRSKRTWSPNIQRIRIVENGQSVRKNVCTTCIRSARVTRAI